MLAAVLEGVRDLQLRDVPTPGAERGQVVVRVEACGICQTDYSAFTGRRMNWEPPMIMGHEMAGVIHEVGKEATEWAVGDEVIISPVITCGKCRWCRLGMSNHCKSGIVLGGDGQEIVWDGGFAQYIGVPTQVLFRKPENISFPAAALTEPLAGSYKGMIEYSQLRLGEDVVIIGAGAIGLLLAQVAMAAGAGRSLVIDLEESRLQKALELGVDFAINASREDVRQRVYELLEDGPDIVFEAAGTLPAAQLAFELVREATRVNMFGVIIPGEIMVSPMRVHWLETRMDASFSITPRVMEKALKLLRMGKVDTEAIITHQFPLTEIHEAMATMEKPERIKVVIRPWE